MSALQRPIESQPAPGPSRRRRSGPPPTGRSGAWPALTAVLAFATLALAGCTARVAGQPQDDHSTVVAAPSTGPSQQGTTATAPSTALSSALSLVPAGDAWAWVVDQAAIKAKSGLSAVTGNTPSTSTAAHEYLTTIATYDALGGLGNTAAAMQGDAWSYADVDWAVTMQAASGPPVTVYRLRDGLDMSTVITSLGQHLTRSGPSAQPRFTVDLADASAGTDPVADAFLTGVTVIPAQHLLVAGAEPDAVLALAARPAGSLGDSDLGRTLLTAAGSDEQVILTWGSDACAAPRLGPSTNPLISSAQASQTAGLGRIEWAVIGQIDQRHARVVAGYASPAAAAADLSARRARITTGLSPVAQQLYRTLLGPVQVTAAGSDLVYTMSDLPRSTQLVTMQSELDEPWAICGS